MTETGALESNVGIRLAQEADLATITQLALGLERSNKGFNALSVEETQARIHDAVFGPNPSTMVFLIEIVGEDEAASGLAFVNRVFPNDSHRHGLRINNIYISPNARTKFLPLHFGSWLIRYAQENDYGRILWNTPKSDKGSILAYRAVGFEGEDQEMIRLAHNKFDETRAAIERLLARAPAL